jgi:hypothetical protein
VRIPVIWGPTHMQHARLYYTMLALHRADLHENLRHHPQGREHARRRDRRAGARLHLAFFRKFGITEAKFNAAYDSVEVSRT